MRGDTTLPLHPAAALEHITRTFLSSTGRAYPAAVAVPPSRPSPNPTPQVSAAPTGAAGDAGDASTTSAAATTAAGAIAGTSGSPSPTPSGEAASGGGGAGKGQATAGGGGAAAAAAAGAAAAAAAMIVTRGFDREDERVQAWAEETSGEFPTRRAAENRVLRVCVALSEQMPANSSIRIRCYNERLTE